MHSAIRNLFVASPLASHTFFWHEQLKIRWRENLSSYTKICGKHVGLAHTSAGCTIFAKHESRYQ